MNTSKKFALLFILSLSSSFAAKTNIRSTSQYTVGPSLQPLVIVGEGWSQQFTIINVEYNAPAEPTVGTLRFFDSKGDPWRIAFKGRGSVDQIPVNLKSGEMLMVETEVSNAPQKLGWAYLDLPSSTEWGIYHAFTSFRKQAADRPDLMTSVPFADALEDDWIIPFDNRDGKYPGIALVNTASRAASFTFDVHDAAGALRRTFTKTIAARSLLWFSLVGEYPDVAELNGQIKIKGGVLSSAPFTLQFTPNGAFTALPVVHTYGR